MTISADLLPHTITIITPVEVQDSRGATVLSYRPEDGATTRTAAAYVRPVRAGEDTGDRDAIDRRRQAHTNDMAVTALERAQHDDVTYAVDGEPQVWRTTPGGTGHTKLQLRRVDG